MDPAITHIAMDLTITHIITYVSLSQGLRGDGNLGGIFHSYFQFDAVQEAAGGFVNCCIDRSGVVWAQDVL